jgi:protein-tyrosine-phosphatase
VVNARKQVEVPGFEGFEKIGFRIPDTVFCQELLKLLTHPVSSSSVNLAGKKNLINMREIRRTFQHKVDLVLDGGAVKSTKGSSVIDISSSPPSLLREGEISREVLEKMISTKIKSTINRKYTITFVCSGNICRSPIAEGILKKKLDIDALKGKVEIDSAGTLHLPSSVASLKAVEVAAEHGVNIENHLSRPVSRAIVDHANMILCLAENHYDYFNKNYPAYKDKIHLLKGFDNSDKFTGLSIDDPIGQSEEFYRRIYDEINQEIDRILPALIKNIIKYVYPF